MLKNRQRAGRFFSAGVALGLSLAGFSPYLIRFVKHNTAHTGGAPYSVPVILNDVVGKLFLGEHVFFAVLAWILFVCGIAWLLRSPTRRTEYRFFAGIVLLTMLMLAWATSRSQYLSVRYFSPVAPFVIMVFGVGIRAISDWVAARLKRDWSDYLAFGFTGLVLVCTFFMYLIPLYGLKHKEADQFSSVAEWLNGHLEPGTPYLWYSGYLMRWVPGYYPTPGLQAVSPYVHGPGREELARLNERHLDFIRRFPVSAFVGPTHETIDVEAGLWPWPKQRYKRHAEVTDESLKRLARRGIFIWEPYRKWTREDGTTDIFYNTREDAVDVVRDRGDAAYFDFAGWQCQAVAGHPQGLWMEYAWAIEGARASIRVMNVRPEAVSGRLVLHAAAAGFQGGRFPLRLVLDGQACGGGEVTAGQFVAIASEPVRLPVGQWVELQLDARSPGMNNPRALLVHDAQFLPGPSPQP